MPTLKLAYEFISKPSPIIASQKGVDPNLVDVQVIVSNPSEFSVSMTKITIDIPVGEELEHNLSATLPPAVYDTGGPWFITTKDGTVTIVPGPGHKGEVDKAIVLTLPGIVVNERPGRVQLTVTEHPAPPTPHAPPPPTIIDAKTYVLQKQLADLPVANFHAEPPTLADLGKSVVLKWTTTGTIYGVEPIFGLRADPPLEGLNPCVPDGACYTKDEGTRGVVVTDVDETTTFTLDVVSNAGGEGHRTTVGSLTTTVRVATPRFSPDARITPLFGGRVLRLHWRAYNAAYCTVQVDDGTTLDAHAPTDTYNGGYLCVPPVQDKTPEITVYAHAATGDAQTFLRFPRQQIAQLAPIPGIDGPGSVALSQDRALAIVGAPFMERSASVRLVNLLDRTGDRPPLAVPGGLTAVAISPDGRQALICTGTGISDSMYAGDVSVVDIAGWQVEAATVPAPQPGWIAITPNGKTALVGSLVTPDLVVIDIPGRKVVTKLTTLWASSGITADEKNVLAFKRADETVMVFTIPDVYWDTGNPTSMDLKGTVNASAIIPEGAFALVAAGSDHSAAVIKIAEHKIESTAIPPGKRAPSFTLSPDGSIALVRDADGNTRMLVDLTIRNTVTITWTGWPSIAIAPGIVAEISPDFANHGVVNGLVSVI